MSETAMRGFFRINFSGDRARMRASYARSARVLTNTRSLAACSMLLALQVALGMTSTISVGQYFRVSFDFLALASVGMLFGPVPAALCGCLSDLLLFVVRPMGPYFPGFTLTAALGGLAYGLFLYERLDFLHIALAKLVVNLVVNLGVNSLNLMLLYGNVTQAILLNRLIINLVKLPVDVAMLSALLVAVRSIARRTRLIT